MNKRYTAAQAHAAVKRGAKWLDKRCPDWFTKLDLNKLDLANGDRCVLGQTAVCLVEPDFEPLLPGYWRVVLKVGLSTETDVERLGFNIPYPSWVFENELARYEMLAIAWREYVRGRLELQA